METPKLNESHKVKFIDMFGSIKGARFYDRMRDYMEHDYSNSEEICSGDRMTVLKRNRSLMNSNPLMRAIARAWIAQGDFAGFRALTDNPEYNDTIEVGVEAYFKDLTLDGKSLQELLDTIGMELFVAGEIFLIKQANGFFEVVRSEYIGSARKPSNPDEKDGIVKNEYGRPVAYRFNRPNKYGQFDNSEGKSELIPADKVLHIKDGEFLINGRPIGRASAITHLLVDMENMLEAKVFKVLINSMIAFVQFGGEEENYHAENSDSAITGTDAMNKQTEPSAMAQLARQMKPGQFRIAAGNAGKGDVKVLETQHYIQDFRDIFCLIAQVMSGPVGIPAERWFTGMGNATYSSSKAINAIAADTCRRYQKTLVEKVVEPIFLHWRTFNELMRNIPKCPKGQLGKYDISFTPLRSLDPLEDIKAAQLRLQTGVSNIPEELALMGKYYDEWRATRKQVLKDLKADADEIGVPLWAMMIGPTQNTQAPTQQPQQPNN